MVIKESMPSVTPPNINIPRERLTSEVESVGGDSVSNELTKFLLDGTSDNVQTDSVKQHLGSNLKKMGPSSTTSDDTIVAIPTSSQNEQE